MNINQQLKLIHYYIIERTEPFKKENYTIKYTDNKRKNFNIDNVLYKNIPVKKLINFLDY